MGGYCLETGWWWRYGLTEEERRRTVRSRASMGYEIMFGTVFTAYAMVVIRKDLPGRAGEAVLLRGDNSSAAQWVTN